MKLVCRNLAAPGHPHILGKVADHRGQVEVKCDRCGQLNTFGEGLHATMEVRCPGTFRNSGEGWCGALNMKISPDTTGEIRYVCRNCRQPRTIRIDTPAMAFSS